MGFARHKDPQLDAAGALADLLVFSLNLTGLDILQKIENQDNSWWSYRLLFKDLWHADRKQDRNAVAKPLLSILQEVEGGPVVKNKVLHLFRDSGVILLASGALQAFAIASGWEQSSFMRRHFLGRALVTVPPEWIDAIFPGVRKLLEMVQTRNARMQSGKAQADDLISDRAAEGFLQTVLYSGICFWQNLPFNTQRYGLSYVLHRLPAVANIIVTPEYLQYTQQVMCSHDRANKQAEMDVSPAMGDMLTEMQGCLKQLCGNSSVGNPEAVAQLIAEKVAAMNVGQSQGPGTTRLQDNCDDVLALPAPVQMAAADAHVRLSPEVQGFTSGLIMAPSLYDTSGSISSIPLAWSEWNHGPITIAERVKQIKAEPTLVLGRRNSSLHKKNRHLPQLIESLMHLGATDVSAVSLLVHIAESMSLTLDQMREGARLLASQTAKLDHHTLTAETAVTLGQYKQAVQQACQQVTSKATGQAAGPA
ncbi:TPA: hypothetical protein ACH3X2_006634 [Trebouxia sp. C0005]